MESETLIESQKAEYIKQLLFAYNEKKELRKSSQSQVLSLANRIKLLTKEEENVMIYFN